MQKITKGMRLDTELIRFIESKAKQQDRSFSNMVETILKQYRENDEYHYECCCGATHELYKKFNGVCHCSIHLNEDDKKPKTRK